MKKFFIAPSILSADFSRLGEDVQKALSAGGDIVHFDVMDNHYVPNLTIGPMVLKSLKDYKITAPIDVHLMVKPVDNLIPIFAKSGADCITIHPETTDHVDKTLTLIKNSGCKVGLGFNPSTSLSILDYTMDKIDIILLMGVNPGFSGQSFIPKMLDKLREIRIRIDKFFPNILLEVDGGIKLSNISDIASAGADIFVVGSAIFSSKNYFKIIQNMKSKLYSI
ncbi:ribulose-phosphate 3-epimerase [Buchnera aphidicola]|uniref:ribulose-phosphate 3-epimerase n=1 Tax=Buchnera aphidicola TaxID=9 RepID=UPI0034640C7F